MRKRIKTLFVHKHSSNATNQTIVEHLDEFDVFEPTVIRKQNHFLQREIEANVCLLILSVSLRPAGLDAKSSNEVLEKMKTTSSVLNVAVLKYLKEAVEGINRRN